MLERLSVDRKSLQMALPQNWFPQKFPASYNYGSCFVIVVATLWEREREQ